MWWRPGLCAGNRGAASCGLRPATDPVGITKHRAQARRCGCGVVSAGAVPSRGHRGDLLRARGGRARGLLVGRQHVSVARTAEMMADRLGARVAAKLWWVHGACTESPTLAHRAPRGAQVHRPGWDLAATDFSRLSTSGSGPWLRTASLSPRTLSAGVRPSSPGPVSGPADTRDAVCVGARFRDRLTATKGSAPHTVSGVLPGPVT